jgi:Novel STAND NTPase 3/Restriction endonuclease
MGKFDDLSDLDFEELVADLAAAEYKLRFRAGTRGRDQGIDVLAIDKDDRKHVIQCKHFKDSSNAQLRTAARKEAQALHSSKAKYASYRFATSRRLTHRFRKELAELLSPWTRSVDDVLGEGDLKALLRKHPDVEAGHVKLWLAGAGPLQALLNAAAFERSAALLEETRSALPRYVQTAAFFEARDILRNEGVCVIAGTAGVGKTTLARMLMLDSMEEGFMPYEIAPGGLKDAWSLLSLDEPQLFYFDDFLGQTALHESRHHDGDLLRLMRKIARDPKRRFVLATREYILRQAKLLSESLDRESKDAQNFLLTIKHYSRQERARIFYNHIYFSGYVDEVARRSLIANRGYLAVIDHANYNPRLIEWLTGYTGQILSEQDKRNFSEYCLGVLNHPKMLWSHAFNQGLDDPERALLIALLGLPRRISDEDAERSFEAACAVRGIATTDQRYVRSLKALDDSFIVSEEGFEQLFLAFINPSVIDFLRQYLVDSRPDAELAIRSACFFDQVLWLWHALADGNDAPESVFSTLFSAAFERTLKANPPQGADIWLMLGRQMRSAAALLHTRLTEFLPLLDDSPELALAAKSWLMSEGTQWLEFLDDGERGMDSSAPSIAARLVKVEALDEEVSIQVLKAAIGAMGPDLCYWECMAALSSSFPKAFTEDEWARHRGNFQEYLDYALEEPAGYLETSEEVGSLEDLASVFGSAADTYLFDEARDEIAEMEAEGERPDDYENYDEDARSIADFGESDHDIESMFERFDS